MLSTFEDAYMQQKFLAKCAALDASNNNCPSPPTHRFLHRGLYAFVCENCLKNMQDGAYGDELKESAANAKEIGA